jgi:hypothetical protein
MLVVAAVAILAGIACNLPQYPPSPTSPATATPVAAPPATAPATAEPAPTIAPQATIISAGGTGQGDISPEPPRPTPAPTNTGGQRAVTLDDQGQTVQMKVGESFLLALCDQMDWTVNISDQSVLSRATNILVVRGAQGVYTAHKPGTATLTAVGDLPCRKSTPPCMAPSRLFSITVVASQ